MAKQLLVVSTLALPVTYLALSDSPAAAFFGTITLPATISFILVPVLSFLEHTRSVAPSKLLGLFLWTNCVEGVVHAVRIRDTGIFRHRDGLVIMMPLVSMLLLAVAEGLSKHSLIKLDAAKYYKL